MKKLLLWLSLCLILCVRSFAQEVYTKIEDRIIASDYIFEGVVIKTYPYMTADGMRIYTSNVIQITKIFKGDSTFSCGTIELITSGGQLPDIGMCGSHLLQMSVGDQGLFLCDQNTKELPQSSYFPFTVPTKVNPKFEWQSFIKYLYNYNNLSAYDIWGAYDSLSQIYDLTQLLTQISYTDCSDGHLLPPPPAPPVQTYHPDHMPQYTRQQTEQVVTRLQQLAGRKRQTNLSRSTVTLYYNMSNPIITGTNPKYLEFDINLKDDGSGDYLINAAPHILLPTGTFRDSVVANGLIQITATGLLADTTQYYPVVPVDFSANEFAIGFSSVLYPTNMLPLASSFQQIAHVKIQMANCNGGAVSFTNQTDMLNASYYSTAPDTSGGFNQYDAVDATQSFTVPGCSAHITSFDPLVVDGGVGTTLNIHGYQLGAARGSGNLYFYDANDPSAGISTPLDSIDYLSWSDTLITITVPSINNNNTNGPALGSGTFRIVTNTGDTNTSSTPLTIFYSLLNVIDTSRAKLRNYLYNMSGNGGYQFFIDTSVSNHPDYIGVVKKAMQDWVCATGVNLSILRDTFGLPNTARNDGVNLITFGPLSSSLLALCTNTTGVCPALPRIGLYVDKDIAISNDPSITWFIDTTGALPVPAGQSDMYHAVLHEFGHAVGHSHIIDSTKIMYYAVPSTLTALPANQRIVDIKIDDPCIDGGRAEVTNSSISHGCKTAMVPLSTCMGYNSISNVNAPGSNVLVYPNPFDNLINIESEVPIESVSISGLDGNLITRWDDDKKATLMVQIPVSLSPGIYLMTIQTQNAFTIKKIIHD